ncbi:MAG: DUF1566 domain-containing protein [Acidobacteria bacterium]|nr:DUF1566 domain-containing protein [Acidobacteriota bacterium]
MTLAGASNWRLPNIKELASINDKTRVRPSLHLTAFPNAVAARFLASTTQVNQTVRAWTVDALRHFESKRKNERVRSFL